MKSHPTKRTKPAAKRSKSGARSTTFGPGPITDVNQLTAVTPAVAAQIKTACGVFSSGKAMQRTALVSPDLVTRPGTERWPVKTGQDPDRNAVGKNILNDQDLGAGFVPATVEELISFARPPGLEVLTADPPQFQSKRDGTAEATIWQVEATITVLNQEQDGDYHLVIQGASGATMVAEVPTPTVTFVGDSPWLADLQVARKAVDDKLVSPLAPQDFVLLPGGRKLVPRASLSGDLPQPSMNHIALPRSFTVQAAERGTPAVTFQTAITPTRAQITGVGFFDRAHGATGAAPNVIEIHPVLKIVWL